MSFAFLTGIRIRVSRDFCIANKAAISSDPADRARLGDSKPVSKV